MADIFHQRQELVMRTIAFDTTDRVPVVLEYAGFAAYVTDTLMADFLRDPELNLAVMLEAWDMVGPGDAINYGSFWPYGLCESFLCKVRVPGVDLPADEMWQMDETELMKPEDYDRILESDWPEYFRGFLAERVLDDVPPEYLPPQRHFPDAVTAWREKGVPVLSGGDVTTPYELLCGARSLMEFCVDLMTIPDKLAAVMDHIAPHLSQAAIASAKARGQSGVWLGGWRTAPQNLSPEMWDRFVWPYFRQLVGEISDAGLVTYLHLDSDWSRELARFRELPAGKCVMALDGETDIRAARRELADHMCIMGDVPASLLFDGTAEEVSEYCETLMSDMNNLGGDTGFILQSGCDIPTNAKPENVAAMVRAATG